MIFSITCLLSRCHLMPLAKYFIIKSKMPCALLLQIWLCTYAHVEQSSQNEQFWFAGTAFKGCSWKNIANYSNSILSSLAVKGSMFKSSQDRHNAIPSAEHFLWPWSWGLSPFACTSQHQSLKMKQGESADHTEMWWFTASKVQIVLKCYRHININYWKWNKDRVLTTLTCRAKGCVMHKSLYTIFSKRGYCWDEKARLCGTSCLMILRTLLTLWQILTSISPDYCPTKLALKKTK